MSYEKIGDSVLRKTENVEQTTDMQYDTLLARRASFVTSREYLDAQIADIDVLIAEAVKLGLKTLAEVTAEMEAAAALENEGQVP